MIRACATKDFIKWRDHWIEGQRLVNTCDMEYEEIDSIITSKSKNVQKRSKELKHLFPPENPEVTLSRFLKYFIEHPKYRGRLTKIKNRELKSWFWQQTIKWGGVDYLQAFLFPHNEMTLASLVMFLCDTGANVSVGLSLSVNCLENSNEVGYKTVKSIKNRAGGKLIINEFPIRDRSTNLSCVNVLETYQEASQLIRKIASEKVAERLFLYVGWSGSVEGLPMPRWGKWFKFFLKRHPELADIQIQGKMIRPSVLMQATYDKNAGIFASNIIGDHNSLSTTTSYVTRYPNQVIWERMIREFQALFQVTAIHSIAGAR